MKKRILSFFRDLLDPDPEGLSNRINHNQLQCFESVLRKAGRSLWNFKSILEFGCGEGRFLELINRLVTPPQLLGCDILPSRIQGCKNKLPHARIFRNQTLPPLDLADGTVEFPFSYSVFTHLSETNHLGWLRELARVLKPGGCMLHSFESGDFLWRARSFSPQVLPKYAISPDDEKQLLDPTKPFYLYTVDEPKTPAYGPALFNRAYVTARWPEASGLRIEFIENGSVEAYPEGAHDLVLLSKP